MAMGLSGDTWRPLCNSGTFTCLMLIVDYGLGYKALLDSNQFLILIVELHRHCRKIIGQS